MNLETKRRIWVLQDEYDDLRARNQRAIRRYDRSDDGSVLKRVAEEEMAEIGAKINSVEEQLERLID